MAGRVLALELHDGGLRAAVVESSLRRFRITEVVDLSDADFPAALGDARWDRVTVGLSAESAAFRFLDLPFADKRRISQTAAVALEEHVPFTLEDSETAWDRSGPARGAAVLAVMVLTEHLDTLRRRLLSLGIEQAELVWTPSSTLECFRRCQPDNATFLAVDSSLGATTVASVHEGTLTGIRVLRTGSPDRTARDVAWSVASLAPGTERVVCGGPLSSVALEEFRGRLDGHKVETLTGNCPVEAPDDLAASWVDNTALLGLAAAAGGECGRPLIVFGHGRARGTAANLEEAGGRSLAAWSLATALLLTTAAGLDHVRVSREHGALLRQADSITSRVMPSAAGNSGRKLKLEMRLSELERRIGQSSASVAHSSPLSILVAMSSAVATEIAVELDSYLYAPPSVRLAGHGTDYEAVTRLEQALRAEKSFSTVEVIEVHSDVGGTGVDFQLEITLAATGTVREG